MLVTIDTAQSEHMKTSGVKSQELHVVRLIKINRPKKIMFVLVTLIAVRIFLKSY